MQPNLQSVIKGGVDKPIEKPEIVLVTATGWRDDDLHGHATVDHHVCNPVNCRPNCPPSVGCVPPPRPPGPCGPRR